MSDKPVSIRAAQAVAIFTSCSASGLSLGISTFLIPRILDSPTRVMLHQLLDSVQVGSRLFPVLSATAAIPYWYLAYRFWNGTGGRFNAGGGLFGLAPASTYLLAAGLQMAIVPYTLAVIYPINRKLARKAEEADAAASQAEVDAKEAAGPVEESAKYLVDHWGVMHLVRAALVAAGGIVGISASL